MVTVIAKMRPISGDMFFTAEPVRKRIDGMKLRELSRIGAYSRSDARRMIKPARILNRKERRAAKKLGKAEPKPIYEGSKAGEAPRTRAPGEPIKRILFGYDAHGGPDQSGVLVVGYGLAFTQKTDVPERLERGGRIRTRKGRTIQTAARPVLAPALAKNAAKASAYFSGSL
jgi:hypothetical protein